MQEIIAICGLTCTECPAYLATQHDSDDERKRVAKMWSQQFNSQVKPEDVNCDGCLPGQSRYFHYCLECDIRACGEARGVKNCAYCEDYACEKLEHFLGIVPAAKTKLDAIRAGL
jgi:hypothetical protein